MTDHSTQNIAVFGLGSMGYGMAQSLLRAGHQVHGFDLLPEAMERFQADGGAPGALADIAPHLDVVVAVVLNAEQTASVLFGDQGVVPRLKDGAVVVSCATVPPQFAIDAEARCAAVNVHYLDAPISGGSVKAAAGELSVMAAGRPDAFAAAGAVLEATSETVFKMGDQAGPGSVMKSVNQLLAGVHIATMAEAITFGMQQGLAPDRFLEVIAKCAGTSWMLENRAPHIIDGDYTPHSQLNIWLKDLGIVLDIAKSNNFSAPITAAALQQYVAASGMGLGQQDDAAIAKLYARNANQQLPGEES
ncbi:NAD(P)-dependent oxidoreductase [Alphaproteobacteria bacterium]|nr:NAD(P)-dependent oxidoreductase [Alphaproteobacteria bacterium]